MNRSLRKLIAFSAAAAMASNVPLLGANAKYTAEQITENEFDTMIQYPDKNVYIENGSAEEFDPTRQLVVVGTDGTVKNISLIDAIWSGSLYSSTTMGNYSTTTTSQYTTTTMGIYDFISPTTIDYGFNFNDPSYKFSLSTGLMIVNEGSLQHLVDTNGNVIAGYHSIKRINDSYFKVSDMDGNCGVIDKEGKVIIALTDSITNVSATADGKALFIDGDGKDYFTDLTGKKISDDYEELVNIVSVQDINYGSSPKYEWRTSDRGDRYDYCTPTSFYKVKKGEKYAILDSSSYKMMTDLFDEILLIGDTKPEYKCLNKLYDSSGTEIYNKYAKTYYDESFSVTKQVTDLVYDEEAYYLDYFYCLDENGMEKIWNDEKIKAADVRYLFHKNRDNAEDYYDYHYDQLLDTDMNVLLEGDEIKKISYFCVDVKNGDKHTLYNSKLEKLGEFDQVETNSYFVTALADGKCTVFNSFLEPVLTDMPAEAVNLKVESDHDDNWKQYIKCYYYQDAENINIYDADFKFVKSKAVAEGQKFLINDKLDIFVYDGEYTAKLTGEYYHLSKEGENSKIVDIDGNLITEVDGNLDVISISPYLYSQVDDILSFYNNKGELIRQFYTNIAFQNITSSDYITPLSNIVINGSKDEETGEKASYIYDLINDTIKYSQVGKYDKIELLDLGFVRTTVYPDGSTPDSEDLWTDDSGYKIGLDKMDGTVFIPPTSGLSLNTSEHCYNGSFDDADRDNAIDIIYNDGVSRGDNPYNIPATGNNDSGYIAANNVFIPVKDFDLDYAAANGYSFAVKTQYGNYVICTTDCKWGMADAEGKALGETKYYRIFEFADGIAYADISEEETYTEHKYDHYDEETGESVYKDVERTRTITKHGLITKNGTELLEPSKQNHMYRYDNTFYSSLYTSTTDEETGNTKITKTDFRIYRGKDYFNDFTEKYGYDTASQCGDLWIVSKNGLKGVVTSSNEEVLPLEFADVMYVPNEIAIMYKQADIVKETFADQHYSSPISDLGDGSKLINVKTVNGKIRAYKLSSDNTIGDLDGDGIIDASDASAVLIEYAAISTGKESGLTEAQRKAADVNGDDIIDATDASSILAYYALVSTSAGEVPSMQDFMSKPQT